MEHELRQNLVLCAAAFVAATGSSLATLGRRAAGDWRFFDRLTDDEKTFTARKYDEVIAWLSTNWPTAAEWPDGVLRPSQQLGQDT